MSDGARRYGLIGLLWLGVILAGAKVPATFFVWSLAALTFIALRLREITKRLSARVYWKELAFLLCVIVSQVFSQDPSVTLYYTLQALVWLMLWMSLKADPDVLPDMPTFMAHLLGMSAVVLAATGWQLVRGPWRAVCGVFPINPIFNASWIACVAAALVAYILAGRRRYSLSIAAVVLVVTCGVLPARSSIIALAVGLLYAIHHQITARRVMLAAVFLTVGFLLMPRALLYRRLRLNEGNYRQSLWMVAVRAAIDHPFAGGGLGNFEMAYARHAFPVDTDAVRYSRTTPFAHNEFLQVAADVGFPAFFILCAGVVGLLFTPVRGDPHTRHVAKTALIILVTLASYNIIWHLPIFIFLTILWSRMLKGTRSSDVPASEGALSAAVIPGTLCVMAAMVLGLGGCALREHWGHAGRWEKVVHWEPSDGWAWKYWADGRPDLGQALWGYQKAVGLVPHQLYFHEALAVALEATRLPANVDLAINERAAALDLAPSRAIDLFAIGRLEFLKGDVAQALGHFEAARRLEPHYWECDLWAARCLARMGARHAAIRALNHLKKRHDDYFLWRDGVYNDLPSFDDSSDYARTILGYNEGVVNRELAALNP